MHHNPQVYRIITNLLTAWEKEGYALGIETQLQLRELTQKLPEDIEIKNLKTLLAPLFTNNRDEQELFYEIFDKSLKENEQFFTESATEPLPKTLIAPPSVGRRLWQEWRDEIVVGLAILAAIWLLKNVLTPKPNPPKEDVFIPVMVNLQVKEEHRMCIDSTNFIEDAIRYVQKITISDTNFFYSVKSIDKITPDSAIKHIQLRTYLQDGKACIYYKGISEGQDTVRYRICLNNKDSCTVANYVFNSYSPSKGRENPLLVDTLSFKEYNHNPDIATLIPTETWRWGWKYGNWDWTKIFIFLGLIVVVLALGKWLNRRKQLIFKDLKGNDKAPYAWTIKIDGANKIGLNDVFYSASNQLRRRSDNEFMRFDVPRTVKATIKQAGRVSFQYRQLTQSNEYLLLIDMPSAANHQAQLFNFLSKALIDNEVLVERFFYDGDIRLCWNETHKRGISLKELQHHYAEHRLIIIGSGHSFLSSINGKLAKWTTIFDHWRVKAMFSTRPASEWDVREAQLAQKFRILPASLKGIGELVETIEAVEAKDYRLWKTVKDPLAQPLRLPETLNDEELMSVLKAEYMRYNNRQPDDRLVQWIAACAVYPTLHWDLTLALVPPALQRGELDSAKNRELPLSNGEKIPPLGGGGASLDDLFTLNRLSWFVDGKIPESARKILLKWLAETHPSVLENTRRQLSDILKNCQPPSDSIAFEDYRLQMVINELHLKPNPRQRKSLETEFEKLLALDAEQDFLVAEYLNRPQTPLDFVVPENLRKYVRVEEKNRLPKKPQWMWQVPSLLLSAGLLYSFNPKITVCEGTSSFHKGKYYCLKTPQDSLTFYEQYLCDNVETGVEVRLIELYDKLIKEAQDSLNDKSVRQNNYEQMVVQFQAQKDSTIRLFAEKGYPQNASIEQATLEECFKLIRNHNLDSASFYRNLPIAYWNAGVLHYNKSFKIPIGTNPKLRGLYQKAQWDSACIFFNKLDKWAWRDSVLRLDEVALLSKICVRDIQQSPTPNPPSQFKDSDFEPYQTRKLYGYRNSRTKADVIPPQYQNALPFSEGLAAIKKGGKWGFIDYFGNEVIPSREIGTGSQYDNVLQSFKGGKAKVQVGKEQFFIDKKGRRIPELVLPQQPPVNPQKLPNATNGAAQNAPSNSQPPILNPNQAPNPQSSTPNPLMPEMIPVEGGTFEMGCDEKRDGNCQEDEKPLHKVTLSSYAIGKYEVTNEEFAAFLNDYGLTTRKGSKDVLIEENDWGIAFRSKGDITTAYYEPQKGYEKFPVVNVTWYGAVAYCEWLSQKTGKNYRLPTEAEWEFAARGGNKSRQYPYSGSNTLGDVAWSMSNSGRRTHTVGTKSANELGIHDMSGNVWEWCIDWFDQNYYKNSPAQNPKGAEKGVLFVVRGGSWYYEYNDCRVSNRANYNPNYMFNDIGFRCVRIN